jgi:hypothetical protein
MGSKIAPYFEKKDSHLKEDSLLKHLDGCTLRPPTEGEKALLTLFGEEFPKDRLVIRGCKNKASDDEGAAQVAGLRGVAGEYNGTDSLGTGARLPLVSFYKGYVSDDYAAADIVSKMIFIHEAAHAAQDAGILPKTTRSDCPVQVKKDQYNVEIKPGLKLSGLCIEQQAVVVETYYGLFLEGQANASDYTSNKIYGPRTPAKAETIRLAVESVLPAAGRLRAAWEQKATKQNVEKVKTEEAPMRKKSARSKKERAATPQPIDPYADNLVLPSPRL